jgi:hypothetical protein
MPIGMCGGYATGLDGPTPPNLGVPRVHHDLRRPSVDHHQGLLDIRPDPGTALIARGLPGAGRQVGLFDARPGPGTARAAGGPVEVPS